MGSDWQEVKRLLADALERPPAERRAFLDGACGGDAELRAELESLLPDDATEREFLGRPATELFERAAPRAGDRLGAYRIVRLIGEGGMGRVYEAEQERPRRSVALKVLRPGFLSAGGEKRFEWEVEALARLSHPGIARIYEAGVHAADDGSITSWFAMELVEGHPLLKAAGTLGLDRRGRLELFVAVCDAIAHAHRRGVIHRDLKPENVLVDAEGAPHVLDFGIARVADPLASQVTTAGEIVGTLAYMSPEQLLGEPERVDARSDVYALGGILFRLLTGAAPTELEGLSLPQVAARLQSTEPRAASRFDRSLRGDLDTILACALASDPERRYGSVEGLAADVRRFLADEPIAARPPTAIYQLRKLARRHRGLAAGVALSLLLLVVAVVGTSLGFLRASEALREARVDRDRARAAHRLLEAMFESAQPEIDGRDVRVVDLLEAGGEQLERDESIEPALRASLHLTLGRTWRQLGRSVEAERHLGLAAELFAATDGPTAVTTLEAESDWIDLALELGRYEEALPRLEAFRELVAGLDSAPAWVAIRPLELEATRTALLGDLRESAAAARAVLRAWEAAEGDVDDPVDTARNNLAVALLQLGEYEEAEALLAASLPGRARRMGAAHPDVLVQRSNLAAARTDLGRAAEAARDLEELEPLAVETWGPTHALTLSVRGHLAVAYDALGRLEESLEIGREIAAATAERHGEHHPETLLARNNLAVTAMRLERWADAERELRAILDSLGSDPERTAGGTSAGDLFGLRVRSNLGSALQGLGRGEEARDVSARALADLEARFGPAHPPTLLARNNHVVLLLDLGSFGEAAALARRNLDLAEEHQPGHAYNAFPFRANLGKALVLAGRADEGLAELRRVERALSMRADALPADLARTREMIGEAERRSASGGAGGG